VVVLGAPGLALVQPVEVALRPVEARTVTVSVRLPGVSAAPSAGQTLPIQFVVQPLADPQTAIRVVENTTFHIPR
jgi:hypothetical protein